MILSDCHLHTDYSGDSETPMEDMVLGGIAQGLSRICFTDHIDYDYPLCPDGTIFTFDADKYLAEIAALRDKYKGKIKILRGMELGLQPGIVSKLNSLLAGRQFDYIIGSSHIAVNGDPYYPDYWENITVHQGLMRYFQSIIDNVRSFSDFDAYGHIDYIIRYIPDVKNKKAPVSDFYSYAKYADILDQVLTTIIAAGKAIEVNTAGYKYGLESPNPSKEIIQRYFALGGRFVTIGSDAHQPAHMAYAFGQTRSLLLSLGIKEYAVFENRQPILLLL